MTTNMTDMLGIQPTLTVAREEYQKYGMEYLIAELKKEVNEVEQAYDEYFETYENGNEDSKLGKLYAHFGEEVADVMIRAWTMLKLAEELDEHCPFKDGFAEAILCWVHAKNLARGYCGEGGEND